VKSAGMTTRIARCELVGSKRPLAALMIVLILGVVTQSPALGATRDNLPIAITGHRAAYVRSCLETKVLKTGGTNFRFPSCWTQSNYTEETTMTTVVAFLSNQPTHQPCTTTRSGKSTTVRCGFPIKTLQRGGVLVMFIAGGMPGWTIANETGQHLFVDHHAARETEIRKPYRSLHATEEFMIFIDRGIPDNYYEFDVFFRNPGIPEDQRLLRKMLSSMRIH